MKIVISGGAGFLGSLVTQQLLDRGVIASPDGHAEAIDQITLLDRWHGSVHAQGHALVERVECDIRDVNAVRAVGDRDDVLVMHLAATVSAAAEEDPELAHQVNVDGTRALLEACRERGGAPRFVFASSVAVFGGEAARNAPSDMTRTTPESTYGCTKAIGELLVNDYTRHGFIDGRIARLPTVIVRPGTANAAASAFASAIFREPLKGCSYVVPVPRETSVVVIGYRAAIDGLIRLLEIDPRALPPADRAVNLPGLSVRVSAMIDSLVRVCGDAMRDRVSVRPDPRITGIAGSWPASWQAERARLLGLAGSESLDAIVREYIEDYHDAAVPASDERRSAELG